MMLRLFYHLKGVNIYNSNPLKSILSRYLGICFKALSCFIVLLYLRRPDSNLLISLLLLTC